MLSPESMRFKQGGDALFELIKQKIIEANPSSASLNWDDFSIFINMSLDTEQGNRLPVALTIKPSAVNKYSWAKSSLPSTGAVGIQRFNIDIIPTTDMLETLFDAPVADGKIVYTDRTKYESAVQFFINSQEGFVFDPSISDTILNNYNLEIDFKEVDLPDHSKDEIDFLNTLTGIDNIDTPYLVNSVKGSFYNIKRYKSASIFLDGNIILNYTPPRRRR